MSYACAAFAQKARVRGRTIEPGEPGQKQHGESRQAWGVSTITPLPIPHTPLGVCPYLCRWCTKEDVFRINNLRVDSAEVRKALHMSVGEIPLNVEPKVVWCPLRKGLAPGLRAWAEVV